MLPVEYHHFPHHHFHQIFLPPQGEADRDEADGYLQLLIAILMEDGPRGLATFLRDSEYYGMQNNSEESDVPEDYSDDEDSMDDEQNDEDE